MELGYKLLRNWIAKRNRQGHVGDKMADRRLIYKWYKDICEVTKYLQTMRMGKLVMDELTSDNIFLTQENRVKVAAIECAINATLNPCNGDTRTGIALSMDTSKDTFQAQLDTYPLGKQTTF